MNKLTTIFCRVVIKLDYIPRYGRTFHLVNGSKIREWRFMKNGLWGFYLLDRMGLTWKFIDEQEGKWEVSHEPFLKPNDKISFMHNWNKGNSK